MKQRRWEVGRLVLDTCPKCGEYKNMSHPALSRKDNKTEICSDCGTKEALEDFVQALARNKKEVKNHDV